VPEFTDKVLVHCFGKLADSCALPPTAFALTLGNAAAQSERSSDVQTKFVEFCLQRFSCGGTQEKSKDFSAPRKLFRQFS